MEKESETLLRIIRLGLLALIVAWSVLIIAPFIGVLLFDFCFDLNDCGCFPFFSIPDFIQTRQVKNIKMPMVVNLRVPVGM